MIHSFLIVGGTVKKRKLEAISGLSGLPARNVRVRSLINLQKSRGSLSEARQIRKPPNFDTTILQPEEDKQTIGIDQTRDLQHQLSLKPYAAKFKTGIILEAQRMTIEAQNALLKTLEEPPAHSVLILTAPSTKKLLPTIVSRCQIVRLRAKIDLDIKSEEYKKGVEEFLTLLQQGRGERLAWAEENKATVSNQQSAISFLEVWISVLRDMLLINSGCQNLALNPLNSLNPQNPPNNLTTILQSMNDSTETLAKALEHTSKTKNLIAKTNVSPRLALEVLLLNLPQFTPSVSEGE